MSSIFHSRKFFFVEVSKQSDSRNGLQALRERSGAGDGVVRGGAPRKTKTIFGEVSKLGDSRNGTQALRERSGAGYGVVRGGAPHKTKSFLLKSAAPFESFRGKFFRPL